MLRIEMLEVGQIEANCYLAGDEQTRKHWLILGQRRTHPKRISML